MPTYDGLWPNDHEMALPPRPELREHDPECSVERGKPRPRPTLGIDRELLTQRKLDDRLFLATPEEGENAVEEGDREIDQLSHGSRMMRDRTVGNESEAKTWSGVSSEDGERGRSGKAQ